MLTKPKLLKALPFTLEIIIMQEPAWTFVEELQKPLHSQKPVFWQDRPAQAGEISPAPGILIQMKFPDPAQGPQTPLAGFYRFLS